MTFSALIFYLRRNGKCRQLRNKYSNGEMFCALIRPTELRNKYNGDENVPRFLFEYCAGYTGEA